MLRMQPLLELQPAQLKALDRVVAKAAAAWGDAELLRALEVRAAEVARTPEPSPEPEVQPGCSEIQLTAAEDEIADDWDTSAEEEAEQHDNIDDHWDASSSAEEDRSTAEAAAVLRVAGPIVNPELATAALDSAAAFAEQQRRPTFIAMLAHRRVLPAFAAASELGRLMDVHDVLIVSGATGCGKSTQIPQLILERALCASPPQHCSVIVTQPRRIAAIGLAERVASERDEECGAGSVGFAIRGEHRRCESTRILYCTVGILLKRLEGREEEHLSCGSQSLAAVTHIVVDEVHERSVEMDLLLLYLRRAHVQHARGIAPPPPKLVLMSATTETEKLAAYFSTEINSAVPVGRLNIEGRTFPVQRHYLEDAVLSSGYSLRYDQIGTAATSSNRRRMMQRGQQQNHERQNTVEDTCAVEVDFSSASTIGAAAEQWMRDLGEKGMLHVLNDVAGGGRQDHTHKTVQTLRSMDLTVVNVDLVVLLAAKLVEDMQCTNVVDVCTSQDVRTECEDETVNAGAGAVLVFLPGIKEIEDSLAAMSNHSVLGDPAVCALFKLHSSVSMEEQSAVFRALDKVKIVVSTNIAETSITIPDVVAVIDAGLQKEMRHSASAGVRTLAPSRITQASAAQRAGRAGRVRPGVCYHLFMRAELSSMAKHQTPEVITADLESLCLRLLANRQPTGDWGRGDPGGESRGGHDVEATIQLLSELIDAPRATDIKRAMRRLRALGALNDESVDKNEDGLSILGRILPRVPTDLWVAKLLLYGAALCVLTPVCVIAASVSTTVALWPQREEARTRRGLDPSSDLMAALRIWQEWSTLRQSDGQSDTRRKDLCALYGLSCAAVEALDREASRLKGEVIAVLPRPTAARADKFASNTGLVRGAVVAALGANIGQSVVADYSANPTNLVYRLSVDVASGGEEAVGVEGRASAHPSSGLYGTRMALVPPEKATVVQRPFVVFTSVVKTSQVFLSGMSVVSPLLAAMFCEDLAPATKADSEAVASGTSVDKNRFSFAGLGGNKKLAVGGADEVTLTLGRSNLWHIKLRNTNAQKVLKFRAAVRLVVDRALMRHQVTSLEPHKTGEGDADAVDGEVVAALAAAAEQLFAATWQAPAGWVAELDPTASTHDYCTLWLYTDREAGITRADKPTQPAGSRQATTAAAMARDARVHGLTSAKRGMGE
eukprot:COSAG02_NODE_554_length_20414_cov_67.356535_22_plen_1176_part_00